MPSGDGRVAGEQDGPISCYKTVFFTGNVSLDLQRRLSQSVTGFLGETATLDRWKLSQCQHEAATSVTSSSC